MLDGLLDEIMNFIENVNYIFTLLYAISTYLYKCSNRKSLKFKLHYLPSKYKHHHICTFKLYTFRILSYAKVFIY